MVYSTTTRHTPYNIYFVFFNKITINFFISILIFPNYNRRLILPKNKNILFHILVFHKIFFHCQIEIWIIGFINNIKQLHTSFLISFSILFKQEVILYFPSCLNNIDTNFHLKNCYSANMVSTLLHISSATLSTIW
ncbi:hypothetical protein SDC9_204532 [bioreactor metagenome]|uniref:Uncharacterized protein n=1 Tax=bioreactor metagenome TaxID=1076179 RepID=A0A645J2A9_9ZZZZ